MHCIVYPPFMLPTLVSFMGKNLWGIWFAEWNLMELESFEGIWLWRNGNWIWWNFTTHLVARNSIPLHKPRNDDFIRLWKSMEFKGFHQIHFANQTSLSNLSFQFHQTPLNSANQTTPLSHPWLFSVHYMRYLSTHTSTLD